MQSWFLQNISDYNYAGWLGSIQKSRLCWRCKKPYRILTSSNSSSSMMLMIVFSIMELTKICQELTRLSESFTIYSQRRLSWSLPVKTKLSWMRWRILATSIINRSTTAAISFNKGYFRSLIAEVSVRSTDNLMQWPSKSWLKVDIMLWYARLGKWFKGLLTIQPFWQIRVGLKLSSVIAMIFSFQEIPMKSMTKIMWLLC